MSSPIEADVWKSKTRSPIGTFRTHISPKIVQLDGTCEEMPSELSKSFPRRKNKLSEFGKGALEKVKGAAGSMRSRTRSRPILNQTEPSISRSPSPPLPCPKDDVKILAPKSCNIPRVLVTSLPAQLCDKDLPQIPTTKRVSYHPERSAASLPTCPSNKPVQKENTRLLHSSSAFSARNCSRDSALSVSRSTNEFRSTVRKIIEESKSEDISKSTENLNRPRSSRPKIVRSMSQLPKSCAGVFEVSLYPIISGLLLKNDT
jgi:hypothetical protein